MDTKHQREPSAYVLHARRCTAQAIAQDGPCPYDVQCVLPAGHDEGDDGTKHRDLAGFHFGPDQVEEWKRCQ